MYSTTTKSGVTAAWRISLGSALVFALGTTIAFLLLHHYVAQEIQRRSDAWLTGEVSVLTDVAEKTPRGALYDRIVDEIAELATKEVPVGRGPVGDPSRAVFFLETDARNVLKLWVGPGDGGIFLRAIQQSHFTPSDPVNLHIAQFPVPYRVVQYLADDGSRIYLGMSERNDRQVLGRLRAWFLVIFIAIVLLGFAITFVSSRRLLRRVQGITETAAAIDEDNLQTRVPSTPGNDEVAQLAATMNRMLDRIARAVGQLHTMSDSLAHDLRSPLTAVRGKLEMALMTDHREQSEDNVASAIEELDRLSNLLTTSLDVAEAKAGALRMHQSRFSLNALVQSMTELYEPSLVEHRITLRIEEDSEIFLHADAGLFHRMLANLLDNAVRHLPPGSTVWIALQQEQDSLRLSIRDNGPGYPPEVQSRLFEKHAKGAASPGHGLGLAFVHAVVTAHRGEIVGSNRESGGTQLILKIPTRTDRTAESFSLVG
jgi:signal transduction histidine kinase